ncbi:family S53 protease-like protein [Mycena vulgaris]|nr:family S53 protease-like protein [Mycena vulgaris]
MSLRNILSLFSVLAVATGSMVVHERRHAPPAGFVSRGLAPADETITLRVGLAANNIAGLEEKLKSISSPQSAEFRQWLSKEEVRGFVQPSAATVSAFEAFASANGLRPTTISPNGDWLSITLPVSRANTLFAAQFEVFAHPSMPGMITRTLSVSLPSELVGHIDVIHPTTEFVEPKSRLAPSINALPRSGPAPSCNSSDPAGVVTPTCLQDLYGVPATPATEQKSALMVTAYEFEAAQNADLAAFLQLLRPDIPANTTFTLLTADNGTNSQDPSKTGDEANLDIQYTLGIATGVPVQFLSVGGDDIAGTNFATVLLDTTTFLDGLDNPPSVVTTSYGQTESNFGTSMAIKICDGYMALGARGISVVFSSGDGGVHGAHAGASVCNNNTFLASFPASCPFVTSVGGTQGFAPEKAVNFTSGGFSNIFAAPAYQTAAVDRFLKTIPADFLGTFNASGRGFPDVAAQAWNFQIVSGGVTDLSGGTSASAPVFAAIISLINDRLVAAGRPILGFLNPWIYSTAASAFTDVTIGHNPGFSCPASSVAFDAAVGWDPLTGFGTPVFSELLAAAMA